MQKLLKYFKRLLMVLLILPILTFAQENSSATKAQKKADKKKQERIEKSRKADLKGKKRHYKIQEKETRKRMKKHRRKVDHTYPSRRPGFFKRLFGKKQSYNYYYFINHPSFTLNDRKEFQIHNRVNDAAEKILPD